MKIAVLSDIHGNLAALHAVLEELAGWGPDRVIVNGDTVNRGPQTFAAWQMVQGQAAQAGWTVLRGNHERYVFSREWERPGMSHLTEEITRQSAWTFRQHHGRTAELAALPTGCTFTAPQGGHLVRIRHASMWRDRDGLYTETPDAQMAAQISPPPAVFVTGHTHRPFIRRIGASLVVNGGSVGVPLDGDSRASYVRLWWADGRWQVAVPRLAYDREATRRAFAESGYLRESGVFSWLLYHEWLGARPLLPAWFHAYQAPVEAGEIDVETAVRRLLYAHDLPVPV
jgi:predicted phosphodiesterase